MQLQSTFALMTLAVAAVHAQENNDADSILDNVDEDTIDDIASAAKSFFGEGSEASGSNSAVENLASDAKSALDDVKSSMESGTDDVKSSAESTVDDVESGLSDAKSMAESGLSDAQSTAESGFDDAKSTVESAVSDSGDSGSDAAASVTAGSAAVTVMAATAAYFL